MKYFLPVCLLLLSAGAHAALNKWVDANGQVHYSDAPPPTGANAQAVPVPAAASGIPEQKSIAEREMDLKKMQQSEQEATQKEAKQREKQQANQDICNQLRARLSTLEAGGRIVSYNEKGEAVFLDDAMLQQRLEETRNRISEECQK